MKKAQRGFTLIEVMVAISLMAVVSIMAWRGLENVSSMQRRLSADADEIDSLVRMLGQLERDVALRAPEALIAGAPNADGSTPPPNPNANPNPNPSPAPNTTPNPGGGRGPGVATLPESLRIVIAQTPDASATLEIIRSDAADPGAWQRVIWFLDGNMLRRAAGLSARQYPLPAAGNGAAILDGIVRFAVRAWVPGQGWITPPFPPAGVRFSGLEFTIERNTDGGTERYRRVVVLE